MKLAIAAFVVVILATVGAVKAIETKHDKDVRECAQRADAHLSTAKLKHPGEVNKVKQAEINKCLAGRGYAVGKIREK
jgi:hypothetical protein